MPFDFSTPDPNDVKPGKYLVECVNVDEKTAQASGDRYWRVRWEEVGTGRRIAEDVFMLAGGGVGMTKRRLKAILGIETGAVEASDMLGKRMWVATTTREFRGEQQPCVDTKAEGSALGYWPESAFEQPPEQALAPEAAPW